MEENYETDNKEKKKKKNRKMVNYELVNGCDISWSEEDKSKEFAKNQVRTKLQAFLFERKNKQERERG